MLPALTLGIEEEYLLVDPDSRDLVTDPPAEFMAACKDRLGEQVAPEFLKCQVEIGTPVCADIAEARGHLASLRTTIIDEAEKCGMRMIAASTHPFAQWETQEHTPAPRYDHLDEDLGGTIRRMLICGMHVHAGIEDADMRIDLMNQLRYFLPHLLALSTSSPFWHGYDMEMHSSRLTIFDSMPRTGIPERYESWAEYQRVVDSLVAAEVIEDGTKIWWDMRPSARFPTLEMRITDICTRMEDALCIAALYQSLLRMLSRMREKNTRWRVYPRVLLEENRWRAEKYGVTDSLIDLGRGRQIPYATLIEEIIDLVSEDAEALGCLNEVLHARTIVAEGNSAQRQRAVFTKVQKDGADAPEALKAVVDMLIEDTKTGLSLEAAA